jgi:hypothetical protein
MFEKILRPTDQDIELRDIARIPLAATGFMCRFGHWPTRLRLNPDHHRGVAALITRQAFEDLEQRVHLTPEAGLCDVVAEDDAGNQWSYGENPIPDSMDAACRWFWRVAP